jgi:predicted PurR-regulated permease PerM
MSVAVMAVLAAVLFIAAPSVVFIVFAGVLFAIFLRGGGGWLARHLPVGAASGVGLFLMVLVLLFGGLSAAFAPTMAEQLNQLSRELPGAIAALGKRLGDMEWIGPGLSNLLEEQISGNAPFTAASALLSGIAAFVLIFFIGLFGAISPALYENGLLALLAPEVRPRARDILGEVAETLRGWIIARLFSMTVVGGLTAVSLWLAGIPLAPVLGLVAALFGFVPNIGPILAALPALLLATIDGWYAVLIVAGIYLAIQTIESYALTPLVEQHETRLPPALVLAAQLLFGTLFGLTGLALASPAVAALMVITREAYVRDYLEGRRS